MANVPISNITATWDDAAQTFYGFRLTVTDTLYNSSSKIFDLLTTGGSKFSVDVAGNVNIAGNITTAAQDVHLSNNTTSSVYIHSGSQGAGANLYLAGAGTLATVSLSVGYTGAILRSPNSLSWTSGTAINTSSDTGLSRYSAGVVKITDGSTGFGSLYAAGIGVGTTTPGELVDVVGNVQAVEFIGSLRGAVLFKAKAGEALTKGDVVYISGISGNITVVSKADANDGSKMPAFGLVKETASSQAACEVYTFGTFQGLDTSSYTEGTELFVSTTAGGLTDTPPSGESSLIQKIAKVTRSHASAGSLKVIGAGRTNATPNLNNGNIFIGNASNQASTASLSSYLAPYAPIASPTFTGTVTVSGDLNVTGTTTTINTTNLDVQDAVITLNKGQVTPANDIGLLFQRYSTPTASNYNVAIAWDESSDKFIFGKTPETGSDNDLTFNTELLTISESGDTTINATGTALTADTSSAFLAQFARNGSTLITLGGGSSTGQFWLEGSVGGNLSFGRENTTADFVMTNSTYIGGGTELFRVTSGGNVGIGTNAPTAKLHVVGSGIVDTSGTGGSLAVNAYGALVGRFRTPYIDAAYKTLAIDAVTGGQIIFSTNNAEHVRIEAGGNVGIGTSAPAAKLHVAGTADQSIIVQSTDNNGKAGVNFKGAGDRGSIYGTASYDIHIEPNAQYGQADVIINSANGTTMNVGIGTSAPAAKLHIADTFNDVSTVHTAFKLDVTDTASAAGSMVIDAQVGGASKFTVANTGDTVVDGALTFASDGAGGNWLKFYRQQANIWRLTTSGIGDVFRILGNNVTFDQNVTIQRGGLLVQPTLTSTAEPFKGIITFNDVTKTYSAFKLDVTDTASAADSSLMDLHLGGTSKASIGIDGTGYFGGAYNGQNIVRIGYNSNPPAGASGMGLWAIGAGRLWLKNYSTLFMGAFGKIVIDASGGGTGIGFASVSKGTPDIGINRDSAGVLKVTDGSTGLGSLKASSILLSTDASLTSETATLATVSATQVASFPTTHLGAKLVIQAADTVSGERQISELTIIHDGTTVSVAEYGIVHTGSAALASYTAAIVSTDVIVSATGASANSTTYKVVETLI